MTLLARAASGQTLKDDAAAYIDQVYRVAVSLTKSKADAEDLVQETYLRALDLSEQFNRGTNLKAWLTRSLYNLFINRYHRERKTVSMDHAREDGEPSLMDAIAASVPGPEVDTLRAELREKRTEGLNGLSEDFAVPIILVDIGECSYAEVAEIISCPIGTVRSRLFRARAIIAGKLRQYVRNAE